MRIEIGGNEVICSNNFTINQEVLNTPSVILNNVYPIDWEEDKDYVSNYYYPADYTNCDIYDDNNHRIFSGVVKNSGQMSLNPREPHYATLQILDYKTFLSEGELDTFVISKKTVSEAINMVIDSIEDYGFAIGTINMTAKDDIIGAYSTKDKTAYDVFNYIADITQSRWFTERSGDSVLINFYDADKLPQGTKLNYTNEWFTQKDIINMSYNYGTWNYRNKQVMTSQQVIGSIVQMQTITYDGYSTQLALDLPIGSVKSILVNGEEKIVASNSEKELGITADFYYKPGNMFIEKSMNLYVGSQIIVNYYPLVEGRQIITNQDEIDRVEEASYVKGVISRYENRNDATTSEELQKIGQSYIKYKGVPEIKLTVETTQDLWKVGRRVEARYMPINELNTWYLVRGKQIHYEVSAGKIFYTFELVSSFNSETAINYFDNQRAKANGNIAEGESVSRNIDISSSANIVFYDTEYNVITINGNNELQTELETILGG